MGKTLRPAREEPGCGVGKRSDGTRLIPDERIPPGRAAPAATLLFPPPTGEIEVGGTFGEAFAWHQVASRLAQGCCTCEVLAARADDVGYLGGAPGSEGWMEPEPGAAEINLSGFEFSPGDIQLVTCFEYGEVAFCVPTAWLADYVANGRARSAEDAMDVLWSRFERRASLTREEALALLHCWNIGTSHREGYTWSAFWPEGGPSWYYSTAVRMAHAYRKYAEDEWSGTEWCTGVKTFIRDALEGGRATNRDGVDCDVRFFFKSIDSRFSSQESEGCKVKLGDGTVVGVPLSKCSVGIAHDGDYVGSDYDNWSLDWTWESEHVGPRWTASVGAAGSNDWPYDTANFSATTTNKWCVWFPVTRTAFRGFVADYLMYWARVALDFGTETGDQDLQRKASLIARFALGTAIPLATTVAHELAHNYATGEHCNRGCCMYVIEERMECAIRADIGIPQKPDMYYVLNSYVESEYSGRSGCDPDGSLDFVCTIPDRTTGGQVDDMVFSATVEAVCT